MREDDHETLESSLKDLFGMDTLVYALEENEKKLALGAPDFK